jgi:hypothetical protein
MKIVEHLHIKGRGDAVVVDALPATLVEGMSVRRVAPGLRGGVIEPTWRVVGIGTFAMPRSHVNGKPADLLLRGDTPLPAVGTEIEVVPGMPEFRKLTHPVYCESGVTPGRRQGCACVSRPEPCDDCVRFNLEMSENFRDKL